MRRFLPKRRFLALVSIVVGFAITPLAAEPQPIFSVVSDEMSEQRRAVSVRLERRLDEVALMNIASNLKARAKRDVAKTQISFFLPGMPTNQGSWANVLFSPAPKLVVSGLRLEDEQLLQAEFQADTRSMLGSWLTSPPAPAGRLTIYSDHGRIFAEWRLRSGMKSVEELREAGSGKVRRFELAGGGSYVLTKSGDIEIWDQATLIAVGDRLRIEAPTAAGLVAARPTPVGRSAPGASGGVLPAQSSKRAEPMVPAPALVAGERGMPAPPSKSADVAGSGVQSLAVVPSVDAVEAAGASENTVQKPVLKAVEAVPQAKAKSRIASTNRAVSKPRVEAQAAAKNRGAITTGDRISAQLTGGF
jgi:hypothetical protein